MDKTAALNLAIGALRHILKEKRRTTFYPDKRAKLEERLVEYENAIAILDGLKDEQHG